MIGKTIILGSLIYTLARMAQSKYAMNLAHLNTGASFGGGLYQVRKKNRRGKIIRRRRSH